MIVTLNWLKEYVDLAGLTPQQIADAFTFSGWEVENYTNLAENLNFVVVGRIDKIEKHPNADKLLVCSIFDGKKHNQIITHATNMKEGDFVPVALDGAQLANGLSIKTTNMRGVDSCGMMCAGEELGIDDSVYTGAETDGIMILDSNTCTVGQSMAEVLGLDDVVYDIKVLANRPDCQSVVGLAKELACALNRPFKSPNLNYTISGEDLAFKVESETEDCPYILGQVVRDVKIEPSPKWLQNRLRTIGLRPINNIVDISNYVLWETGQPLHIYDYEQIQGNKLVVRQAKDKEEIELLNEKKYELNAQNIVIANSEKAMGLAGIMGGASFSVLDTTKDIVIESATFKKEVVRKTARSLGLRTDASGRYEKGVEPISCEIGLNRALHLIEKLKIGKITGTVHKNSDIQFKNKVVEVNYKRILEWLGLDIPLNESINILSKLDIKTKIKQDVLACEIPLIRSDIENFSDIAEEIIRYWGLDKLPTSFNLQTQSITGGYEKSIARNNGVKDLMLVSGANEIKTYTFINIEDLQKLEVNEKDDLYTKIVHIRNPLNASTATMRTQMLSSMLGAVKYNLNHKNSEFALFEIGKIFCDKNSLNQTNSNILPEERDILSYITIEKNMDFFDVKSIVEMLAEKLGLRFSYKLSKIQYLHPNICAEIFLGITKVGSIGKVHPQVLNNFDIQGELYYFELDIGLLPDKKVKKVKPLAKYPSSTRDLSIVVKADVLAGEVVEQIKQSAGILCEQVEFLDIYQGQQIGEDEKSISVRLVFRKQDNTLTQDEINTQVDKVLSQLKIKFNAKLRV